MKTISQEVEGWVARSKVKLNEGSLSTVDLDQLLQIVSNDHLKMRQKLLYLHVQHPTIHSQVLSMALHEPGKPCMDNGITAQPIDWPYNTVYDAIMDGWQVIHFPQQRVPFDARQIDLMGYEFILQKLENYLEG